MMADDFMDWVAETIGVEAVSKGAIDAWLRNSDIVFNEYHYVEQDRQILRPCTDRFKFQFFPWDLFWGLFWGQSPLFNIFLISFGSSLISSHASQSAF